MYPVVIFTFYEMEPNRFVAEVYRRMSLRQPAERRAPKWDQMKGDAVVVQAAKDYRSLLPADKNAAILDVGFGGGWFLAACINLGYTNLAGADFGIEHKSFVKEWSPTIKALYEIDGNIGDFLAGHTAEYDFIHMSQRD
jgi:hypothetical protein